MVSQANLSLFLQLKRWLPQIFKIRKTREVVKNRIKSGIDPVQKMCFYEITRKIRIFCKEHRRPERLTPQNTFYFIFDWHSDGILIISVSLSEVSVLPSHYSWDTPLF